MTYIEFTYRTTTGKELLCEVEFDLIDESYDHAFGREIKFSPVVNFSKSKFYLCHGSKLRQLKEFPKDELDIFIMCADRQWERMQ